MTALLILIGLFAPVIAPHDPYQQDLNFTLQPPSALHLFGTDQYGRDLLARVIYGARISLVEILLGVGMAVAAGVPLGLVSGWYGAGLDESVMWVMNVLFAFSGIVLAILIVSVPGTTLFDLLVAIAIFSIPSTPG